MEALLDRLVEVDYKGLVRKQKSISRLFPEFPDRVKQIGKRGGLRLEGQKPDEWFFKIHSGTKSGVWYDAHLRFKNVREVLRKHVRDKRLWTTDRSRIDRRKLAKAVLYKADMQVDCSCPAQKYYGGDYILSLSKYDAKYGKKEPRAPRVRNPKQYGAVCKHLQNLLNVLPFYEGTMAKWLTKFYDRDIEEMEEVTRAEADWAKAAGAELRKRVEEPEEEKPERKPEEEKPEEEEPKKIVRREEPEPEEEEKPREEEEPKKVRREKPEQEAPPELEDEKPVDFHEPIPLPEPTEVQEEPEEEEEPPAEEPPERRKKKKRELEKEEEEEEEVEESKDYKPGVSRMRGRDSRGRMGRTLQYVMKYKEVEPLVDEEIFVRVRDAHDKTKSPLGYVKYNDVAKELKMPVGRLMQYLKGMHQQNPYSVTFNVNRMGDNVYFKLPSERERKECGEVEESKIKEGNTLRVTSHDSYGNISILSSSGKMYKYRDVSPHMKDKIDRWLKHKQYGTAWQFLRRLERDEDS